MKKVDFLAIGDMVTDAFIELHKDFCKVDENKENISMPFAEKIPFENATIVHAVGNSANAAVAASRLGLSSALISNLGDDDVATACRKALKAEGVDDEFVKNHHGQKTNYHFVLLFEGERTILIKHEDYEYTLPRMPEPRWIYLSSLSEHSLPFHKKISEYLEKHPDVKLAYQPGTFQIKFGIDELADLYKHTEIFFCNFEEAERILKMEAKGDTRQEGAKFLLQEIHKRGPKKVVITDGPAGSYGYENDRFFYTPIFPDRGRVVDRTGAGDSFSSTVVAALALDFPLSIALEWGPVNSMSVVQYIGAREGLLKKKELDRYLAERPTDYKTVEI
jgi:sugar/nucleoside kinase (ribokinase family)